MRSRTIITCGKCSGSFRFKPLKRKLQSGIEMHYIKCRHCSKETVSYYTDEKIRQQLQDNGVKKEKLRELMMASKDEEEIKGYVERINRLSKDVGDQMDILKERIHV